MVKKSDKFSQLFNSSEDAYKVKEILVNNGYVVGGKWVGKFKRPGEIHTLVCALIDNKLLKYPKFTLIDLSVSFYEEFGLKLGIDVSLGTVDGRTTNTIWLEHYQALFKSL